MTNPEVSAMVDPFLNPDYWEGHMLGQGSVEPEPGKVESLYAMHFAASTIRKVSAGSFREHPIEAYEKGDTFQAEDHKEGTLVAFNREEVSADNNLAHINMEEYYGQALPSSPIDLGLIVVDRHLKGWSEAIGASNGRLYYSRALHFGVVAKDLWGRKMLTSISERGASVGWPAGPLRFPFFDQTKEPPEVTVGEVKHHGKKLGHFQERLSRINTLEIRALGIPATKSFFFPSPPRWNS